MSNHPIRAGRFERLAADFLRQAASYREVMEKEETLQVKRFFEGKAEGLEWAAKTLQNAIQKDPGP